MAYCHGPDSPYGCGHHDQHAAAARKGWLTRRRRHAWVNSKDHAALKRIMGDVSDVHTHDTHRHSVMLRRGGKWYELPKAEYKRLIAAGKDDAREAEKERRINERAARLVAQDKAARARRAEQDQRRAERYREAQERQAGKLAKAEYAQVVKRIKEAGGVRPTHNRQTGKTYDRGEWLQLPTELRRKSGKLTLDQAREMVNEHMPWLHLETPDDLTNFFDRAQTYRNHQRHARRLRRVAATAA